MNTAAFQGLECLDCGTLTTWTAASCPDCSGVLVGAYDLNGAQSRPAAGDDQFGSGAVLPVDRETAVTMGEGGTPVTACPDLAADAGVEALYCKDEGRNPTGSVADREAALVVTAALNVGVESVGLPSTGDDGQAIAAYAARAGLESRVFVPSRAGFIRKAMINVHGGDMRVVAGNYPDAVQAFEDANRSGLDCSVSASPLRREATRTVLFELLGALPEPPDAIVVPVAHGTLLAGCFQAANTLVAAGTLASAPRLYAVQPTGCAPVVDAYRRGDDEVAPVEAPDTIAGELEIPAPPAGTLLLTAIEETGGDAIAVEDDALLAAGAAVASRAGLEVGLGGAAAAAAVEPLADRGDLGTDDTVAILNPSAGSKDGDVLRSYLMGQGV